MKIITDFLIAACICSLFCEYCPQIALSGHALVPERNQTNKNVKHAA